jgi:glycosyltransferase involved in cell wall biosynthesis
MIYCIQEIWPLILSKNPKARLKIVGRNPKAELVEIGKKANNVEITGEVNDMREALKGARIFICPMRIGAGMKNKIIESLSMGIPVLVNQKAVEGVEFPNGKVGYIVNDIHEIPDLISQLISNDAGWAILSKNARRFCIDHFNWNDKAHQLAETIKLIILS